MTKIYTTQVAIGKMIQTLGPRPGTLVLNATVKTGDPVFSPTWELVDLIRDFTGTQGQLLEHRKKRYTEQYRQLMLESQSTHPDHWRALANYSTIIVSCYCAIDAFCHRDLLKDYIIEYLASQFSLQASYEGVVSLDQISEHVNPDQELVSYPSLFDQ